MPFISTITRRKEDGGITLRAKIVTPKHKLMRRRDYPIKIKKNALTDYECCVIDSATVTARILNKNEVEGLTVNIDGMDTYGNNDTKIAYSIENIDGDELLTDYLAPSGEVLQRPKYGSVIEVNGYLVITTSKNEEKVISRVPITMAPYTAADVVNDTNLFSADKMWNAIKGGNDAANTNGYQYIIYPLDMTKTPAVSSKSTKPVTIDFTVEDALTSPSAIGGDPLSAPRINITTGAVTRLDYLDAAKRYAAGAYSIINPLNGKGIPMESTIRGRIEALPANARACFQVGGITLRCKAKLDGFTSGKETVIKCMILSKFMTKAQFIEAMERSFKISARNVLTDTSLGLLDVDRGSITTPYNMSVVTGGMTEFSIYNTPNDDPSLFDPTTQLASVANPSTINGIVSGAAITSARVVEYSDTTAPLNVSTDYANCFVTATGGVTDSRGNDAIEEGTGKIRQGMTQYQFTVNHNEWIARNTASKIMKFAINMQMEIPGNVFSTDGELPGTDAMTGSIVMLKGINLSV